MTECFILFLNFVCLTAQSVLQLSFSGRLAQKKPQLWQFAFYLLLLHAAEWAARHTGLAWEFAVAAQILLLYGTLRLALDLHRSDAWVAALLAVYISQFSFGAVNSVEAMLFLTVTNLPMLYGLVAAATAAALLLCACCYAAVLKLFTLTERGPSSEWRLLLLPLLFVFLAEAYVLKTAYSSSFLGVLTAAQRLALTGQHTALLLLQCLGLAALLCTLYAYRRICRGFQAQAALDSLTQAVNAQKIYVSEARQRHVQTRAFRHDLQNHLSVLNGLLAEEKWAEGRAYLQRLTAAAAALSPTYQTGNPVVDILLREKLRMAAESGIVAEISLTLPTPCGIDDFDLCVIFANALDNAIDACRFLGRAGTLCVSGKRQGDFYLLTFTNTCGDSPMPPEGTGLANIRSVAEKYHGMMRTEKNRGRFSLDLLLDISCPPDDISRQKP